MDIFGKKCRETLNKRESDLHNLTQILDNLEELVMLCDTSRENKIFFMNKKSRETMSKYRHQLNTALSGADVANAMGNSIHQFHKNPDRQRRILADLTNKIHEAEFSIGGIWFRLKFYPIWDRSDSKRPACYLACWTEITAEKEVVAKTAAEIERKRYLEERVHQIATAMEEMSVTVNDVAKNTTEASTASNTVVENAMSGQEVVKDAAIGMQNVARIVRDSASLMDKLGEKSNEIGRIVTVINDIADQTNLLALNAAIEAARAGEQGRGFAVVADEVRKLAERTGSATKEIGAMIKEMQGQTSDAVSAMESGRREAESGEVASNKAEEALVRIVDDIQRVKDMVAQIATAAEEQAMTSNDITRNLDEIAGR
ncbi:MAG: methyl-accepting chemotaxis protein [Nitrospirae bacterium]|nr:MAG: methyl-accepting chemotaxis protein [Nitrospirota bacterium]